MREKGLADLPLEQPTFEQSLKRLEEITHALEDGNLGLNESLQRYEEGVKLLRQSYELLERAERRIELLSGIDADGNPITQPFDHVATFDGEKTANSPHRRDGQLDPLLCDGVAPSKRRSRRRTVPSKPLDFGATDPQSRDIGMDEP